MKRTIARLLATTGMAAAELLGTAGVASAQWAVPYTLWYQAAALEPYQVHATFWEHYVDNMGPCESARQALLAPGTVADAYCAHRWEPAREPAPVPVIDTHVPQPETVATPITGWADLLQRILMLLR